jgi:pimeloyl-ACP methyl ester carboxylesterase
VRGAILLLAAAAAGCVTPPVVFPAGFDRLPVEFYPRGTEAVEVPVEGEVLRGVFVPAGEEAPVCLLLLGSGDSATFTGGASWNLARDLRGRGIATLVLDYRGVGTSGGSRSPWNLRADARAAYDEAVRRAGGEERVLVRGMSLGTLAAALLLEEGCRPAAVVLVSPVKAETVAANFARARFPGLLTTLAVPFLRASGEARLVAALRGCPCPLLVLAGDLDHLLSPAEREEVRAAAVAGGGRFVLRAGWGHEGTYRSAVRAFPEETELLGTLFAPTSSSAGR